MVAITTFSAAASRQSARQPKWNTQNPIDGATAMAAIVESPQ